MTARIWHGYTTKTNAPVYEQLVKQEIFPEIEGKKISGYKGAQLLKRDVGDEVEFTTLLWFDRIDSVKGFVGKDHEAVYVPQKAREVLSRYDQRAVHCELLHSLPEVISEE